MPREGIFPTCANQAIVGEYIRFNILCLHLSRRFDTSYEVSSVGELTQDEVIPADQSCAGKGGASGDWVGRKLLSIEMGTRLASVGRERPRRSTMPLVARYLVYHRVVNARNGRESREN